MNPYEEQAASADVVPFNTMRKTPGAFGSRASLIAWLKSSADAASEAGHKVAATRS
jgi:hypothetical protein